MAPSYVRMQLLGFGWQRVRDVSLAFINPDDDECIKVMMRTVMERLQQKNPKQDFQLRPGPSVSNKTGPKLCPFALGAGSVRLSFAMQLVLFCVIVHQ
jgi:hypothetical protein